MDTRASHDQGTTPGHPTSIATCHRRRTHQQSPGQRLFSRDKRYQSPMVMNTRPWPSLTDLDVLTVGSVPTYWTWNAKFRVSHTIVLLGVDPARQVPSSRAQPRHTPRGALEPAPSLQDARHDGTRRSPDNVATCWMLTVPTPCPKWILTVSM